MMRRFLIISGLIFLIRQASFGQKEFTNERIVWIGFEWADASSRDVMLITSHLDTLDYLFRWQLDTGSPYTYLEGGTYKKFADKFPYLTRNIKRVDTASNGNWYKIYTPPFQFEQPVLPAIILKNDKIGGDFRRIYSTNTKASASVLSGSTILRTGCWCLNSNTIRLAVATV